jgi:N2227-like protein
VAVPDASNRLGSFMGRLVPSFFLGFADIFKSGKSLGGDPARVGMTAASTVVVIVVGVVVMVVAAVARTSSQIPSMRVRDDAHSNGTSLAPTRKASFMPTENNRALDRTARTRGSGGYAEAAVPVDVTFVALEHIDWAALGHELSAYERERHAALESLSFQLEVVKMEWLGETRPDDSSRTALQWLINRIQNKMNHLSGLYEHDAQALRDMLRPFRYSLALPPPPPLPPANGSSTPAASTDRILDKTASLESEKASTSSLLDCPTEVCRKRWTAPPAVVAAASTATPSAAVYNTVSQVVAHLVRDWSADGAVIRQSLYDWCVQAVRDRAHEFQEPQNHGARGSTDAFITNLSILVPGAGLGRLAYDLAAAVSVDPSKEWTGRDSGKVASGNGAASCPGSFAVHVHAVEPSLTMVAAAAHVFDRQELHQQPQHQYGDTPPSESATILHPYASDPFTNEVDDDEADEVDDDEADEDHEPTPSGRSSFQSQRYRAVTIEKPALWEHQEVCTSTDGSDHHQSNPPSFLSFTVGDFASAVRAFRPGAGAELTAASPVQLHHFVVTCFFLDTATNPIEYLRLVHEALQPGGYWINVGPLQWHVNAHLALTSRELRRLVVGMGFEILLWKVDDLPLEYRSSRRRRHPRSNGSTTTNADSTSTGSAPHTTRMEAYHPLRFVARKAPPALT